MKHHRLGRSYGSFRDPIGLARRMVGSRDPAALATLARTVATVVAKPLDIVLRRGERRITADPPPSHEPMLFIVGAPRSGTTLVYQVLARHLPVSYPTNLSALFPSSPISAQQLFGRWLRRTPRGVGSFYGNTRSLRDVNDGFHIWDRWLGPERYTGRDSIGADERAEMRRFFDAWRALFAQPLINKNNRNTDSMAIIADVFPEAHFLVVRRDPLCTLQSLVVARQVVQGTGRHGWGLHSRDAASDNIADVIDAVCDQLVEIERRLCDGCAAITPERLLEVSYEAFCADPRPVVLDVAERLGVEPRLDRLQPLEVRTPDLADPNLRRAADRLANLLPSSPVDHTMSDPRGDGPRV
jgi:LPS sulfotransferase NodH